MCHSVSWCLIQSHDASFSLMMSHPFSRNSLSFTLMMSPDFSWCVVNVSWCLIQSNLQSYTVPYSLMMCHSVSWCVIKFYSLSSYILMMSHDVSWCLMMSHDVSSGLIQSQPDSRCLCSGEMVCIWGSSRGYMRCSRVLWSYHVVVRARRNRMRGHARNAHGEWIENATN